MTPTGRYPGYRAPQGDGEILCAPGEAELSALVSRNRHRPEFEAVNWFGRPLGEIALGARTELLQKANDYTRQYADVAVTRGANQPLIVTGHQAELFHPGVWLKNFFATKLAEQEEGTAINLIVDSDLCRGVAIRVPTGFDAEVNFEMVPYDRGLKEMPFEERRIADREVWESFGARVSSKLHRSIRTPLVDDWWPTAVRASRRHQNLGLALSQARHQRELGWGSRTLELPQSCVCQSRAFRYFAMQIILQAAEFREAHNRALTEYRAAHKLRNHAQPVPNLIETDGWTEMPFWLWSVKMPERRGAFVKRTASELIVSDHGEHSVSLPLDPSLAVERLADWERQGTKLRTRALATTLFARLFLADMFIHGIGGAKYDQVTDHICELFFGFALPRYATVSGTLRLPLPSPTRLRQSESTIRQEIRNVRYHPERFQAAMEVAAELASEVETAIAQKRKWVATPKTPFNAARRHDAIKQANASLQRFLIERRAELEHAVGQSKLDAKTAQLLSSREYAYCLFPEDRLREFFRI